MRLPLILTFLLSAALGFSRPVMAGPIVHFDIYETDLYLSSANDQNENCSGFLHKDLVEYNGIIYLCGIWWLDNMSIDYDLHLTRLPKEVPPSDPLGSWTGLLLDLPDMPEIFDRKFFLFVDWQFDCQPLNCQPANGKTASGSLPPK